MDKVKLQITLKLVLFKLWQFFKLIYSNGINATVNSLIIYHEEWVFNSINYGEFLESGGLKGNLR